MHYKFALTLLLMLLNALPAQAQTCQGQLMGINSGRNAIGLLFGLNEGAGEASAQTLTRFSSAALAYDPSLQRIYYASSPRALNYAVDTSALNLDADTVLPIKGSKFRYNKLAYYDIQSQSHTEVGRIKHVIAMVFDETNNRLLAASTSTLYSVDPSTGDSTELLDLSEVKGKYRGDLVFQFGRLFLVTSTHVYEVNFKAGSTDEFESISELSTHNLTSVTGAARNVNGDVVISRVSQNDNGHTNKSEIYQLVPDTGLVCKIADLPVRINDLTFYDNGQSTCYTVPECNIPSFSN